MSDKFGAGVHLDEQFDFAVGSAGDLKNESGVSELEKDLAFRLSSNLQRFLGRPQTGNIEAKVTDVTVRTINADTRVNSVVQDSIEVDFDSANDEISLKARVRTGQGEQELVFEI